MAEADYGIMRTADLKRVAKATRTVENAGRTYVRVPERHARNSGGGSGRITTAAIGSAWTVAEYDPTTGAIIKTFDRGRRRGGSITLADHDIIIGTDGHLFAIGAGRLATDTPAIVKWDIDTDDPEEQRVWDSDNGGFNTPTLPNDTGSNTGTVNLILEASDGAIWGAAGPSTTSHVGRFSASTGAQTHAGYAATNHMVVAKADASGGVVIRDNIGGALRVLNNAATSIATGISATQIVEHNYLLYCLTAAGADLTIADGTLSVQDTRSAPSGTYTGIATNGTTVWTVNSTSYRAYDASNLSIETWNHARDAANSTCIVLLYRHSYLWDFSQHVRKIDPADGSEVWESGSGAFDPSGTQRWTRTAAVGSTFTVHSTADNVTNVYCLNASNGSTRWVDQWLNVHGIVVTDDDRLFVCGRRIGP